MANKRTEEEERQTRSLKIDALTERKHDKNRGIKKAETKHALIEMNIRLRQYVGQFNAFSLGHLIVQTLRDFQNEIELLQKTKTLDLSSPVARWDGKEIYVDSFITKEDFKSSAVEAFTFTEPLRKK